MINKIFQDFSELLKSTPLESVKKNFKALTSSQKTQLLPKLLPKLSLLIKILKNNSLNSIITLFKLLGAFKLKLQVIKAGL
jgi:hypothetical protein